MQAEKHQRWRKGFPYYKVQYWDNKVSAWHDIQKSFSTKAQAKVHGIKLGIRHRITEVTREGRSII